MEYAIWKIWLFLPMWRNNLITQGSQMRWAERPWVGAPTIFKIYVQISIIYVG